MVQRIAYLNTDLDIISPADPAELVASLQARGVSPLHAEQRGDGLFYATLETDEAFDEPEATIAAMLAAIESLPDALTQFWASCTLRELNIGYECGSEPWAFSHGLTPETLRRIATLRAALRLTLYPPDQTKNTNPC